MALNFFENWDIKANILSPVFVNLISAFLLFLAIILFKEPIYRAIKPYPKVENFPLYVISEPYTDETGVVVSELFVINLTSDPYTYNDLETILDLGSSDEDMKIKSDIIISWKWPRGEIISITADREFNDEKGNLEIIGPEAKNGEWRIRVKDILGKGILKAIIMTNYKGTISRAAKASLPFKYKYPGQ